MFYLMDNFKCAFILLFFKKVTSGRLLSCVHNYVDNLDLLHRRLEVENIQMEELQSLKLHDNQIQW